MKEERLVIASNRLPITVTMTGDEFSLKPSSGGLVSGLERVQKERKCLWIGCSGVSEKSENYSKVTEELQKRNLVSVSLDKKTYSSYYNGFCNNVIWPVCHYFTSHVQYREEQWAAYKKANKIFAECIANNCNPNDLIWIHDYQLMLVPKYLREIDERFRISYFHHIPFPSSEIIRICPNSKELLSGLLASDYIGFHTFDYVRHFLSSVNRLVGCETQVDEVHTKSRIIKVAAHPLGIDSELISQKSRKIPDVKKNSIFTFVGIDRLDYTKGIQQRLEAFDLLLETNPEYVGKVVFVQQCVPSRTNIGSYKAMKETIENTVGRINGKYGSAEYSPIQYIYRSLPRDDVIKLYARADAAVITPLRDGLNLVCKEFVASRTNGDGVLILSELAGAAAELSEALKVNPYDANSVAKAMKKAFLMPMSEQKRRMKQLQARVHKYTNVLWASSFLEGFQTFVSQSVPQSVELKGGVRDQFIQKIKDADRVFIFLDNDGTLTPIAPRPDLAIPPQKTIKSLERFQHDSSVTGSIVSGRSRQYCEKYFGNLAFNLVAEHGAYLRYSRNQKWVSIKEGDEFEKFKPDILKFMKFYCEIVPNSLIEEKEASVVWHFRESDPLLGETQAHELSEFLNQMLSNTSLVVCQGKKSLEVKDSRLNKGMAVESILNYCEYRSGDLIITVGDDVTDEDMYRVRPNENLSIHVGRAQVYAKYFVPSLKEIETLLEDLAQLTT